MTTKPTKPFHEVIRDLCGQEVIRLGSRAETDRRLLAILGASLKEVIRALQETPIEAGRPNEVGNRIEQPVMDAREQK